jgi:hypothetical protein
MPQPDSLKHLSVEVEELPHGVTRTWLHGRCMVIYTPPDTTRAHVDTWATAVIEDVTHWPTDRPFLALHDFTRLGVTPYNREKGIAVLKAVPDELGGRHAFLLQRGALGQAMKFFGARSFRKHCPQLEPAFFFDYDAALEWLREGLLDEVD